MFVWLYRELRGLVELFFPAACPCCNKTFPDLATEPFCPSCAADISRLPTGRCSRCALPFTAADGTPHYCSSCNQSLPPYLSVHAAGVYEGQLRRIIHRFKYEQGHNLDRPLARLIEPALGGLPSCDLIVPVPLHPQRLRARSYNQSLLLARELGRLLGRPVLAGQLQRTRATRPQQGLKAGERERNMKDAFRAVSPLSGEQVLLVDDVMTTGATAAACSRELLAAGAAAVRVAVAGRAGRG